MKVYDIWCSELTEVVDAVWTTTYGDSLDEIQAFMEVCFPGCDWIIIENELPF